MTTDNLLPCPFCGHDDMLLVEHKENTVVHPAYRVRCDYCGASSAFTDHDHVAAWNCRAAPEAETSASASGAAIRQGWDVDDLLTKRAPAAPVGDAELPPLPEPMLEGVDHELWGQNVKSDVWSAEQMRAYARAAQALVRQPGGEVAPLDEAAERARFWAWARAKVSPGLMDAWIAAKRDAAQTAATVPGGEVRKPLTEADILAGVRSTRDAGLVVNFAQGVRYAERMHRIVVTTTSEGGAS